jgi:hypothetical protein
MNLRNFQTQLNDAANKAHQRTGDADPIVIVVSQHGTFDLEVEHIFVSELDGKVCIRLREEVKALGRAS